MNRICTTKAKEIINNSNGKFLSLEWIKIDGTYRSMVARNKVTKYSNGGYLRYNLEDHDLILLVDVSLAKKYKKGILDKNGKTRKPFVQVKYKNLKKLTYQGIVNTVLECAYDIKENESNSNFGGCFSCEISHHKKGHS
tara:strand:- start:2762 stop:3178 length:417 start_codon:yes stop_codon:yes gene_type:complete